MTQAALSHVAYLVLTAVVDGPKHGYAILDDVRTVSGGSVVLHTGTLYAILERLHGGGLIEVDREEVVASRLRRYYRITGAGVTRLTVETERMTQAARTASRRLAAVTPHAAGGAA
ncbi:PadR family transcriptional regulator [Hamadaea sp. NPDC050747]|uniref:PadR family transcriptional regulator n=1 Tax=Hamadaea sp. NPDC050747 TaxID=3155789 RepID=UPI0033E6626B